MSGTEHDAQLLIECRPLVALVKLHEWGESRALVTLKTVQKFYSEYAVFLLGCIMAYESMDPAIIEEHLIERCGSVDCDVQDFRLFLQKLSRAFSAAKQ